jgi:ADP-ribose diphosphatase
VGKYCLEVPAGLVDIGEDIESAALRELEEETGYVVGTSLLLSLSV